MEGIIKIDAGRMDKKFFYAFIKGLTNIKYKDYYLRASKDVNGKADIDENMDLSFLYANLFN